MKLSRRELLVQLSAAGSAGLLGSRAWGLQRAAGNRSQSNPVRVLFEGPWLLCPESTAGGEVLVARAPLDPSDGLNLKHSCQLGAWNGSAFSNPYSTQPGFFQVNGSDHWKATRSGASPASFNSLFRPAAGSGSHRPIFVGKYVPNNRFGGDVLVQLPMPDSVCAAGKLTNARLQSSDSHTPAPGSPIFLTTMLTYNSGSKLAFAAGGKHAALSPAEGQDLIFQLYQVETGAPDPMHPPQAFKALMMRLSTSATNAAPPPLSLDWPSPQNVLSGAGDCSGVTSDTELGIAGPGAQPQKLRPRYTTPANCSSGGVVSGGGG